MADNKFRSGLEPRGSSPSTVSLAHRSRARWLLFALLAGGVGFAAWWYGNSKQPSDVPLDGRISVAVRTSGRAKDSLGVEEAGALPVRADGWMSLEVHFNQPAYSYMVWLDTDGKVLPLYPWNNETLEVTDINRPPPKRQPSRLVINPMAIGSGWKFGSRGGMETALVLARRTPLDPNTRLGTFITPLPHTKVRHREEVVILGLDPGSKSVATVLAQNRGADEEARAADEPVQALLLRLRDHFEFVRAVRFAHEGE